jgi:hypothetical protein
MPYAVYGPFGRAAQIAEPESEKSVSYQMLFFKKCFFTDYVKWLSQMTKWVEAEKK